MFAKRTNTKSGLLATIEFLELVYHSTTRALRKTHGNALIGLLLSMLQTIMMVVVFYVMFELLQLRGMSLRGDFFMFLLSGIFIYMTHIKVMGSILSSEGPTSPMMMHAPMNTFVAILAASFSSLYIQMLSLAVIIGGYHVAIKPVEIHDPFGAFMMILLGWFSGIGVGLVFLALKPWFPGFTQQLNSFYTRVNIFASGKMTVGNMLPYTLLPMFLWNPLFHIIDQARGYVFVNYFPHHTNYWYPLILSVVLILIGLMAESYTRKHASLSWFARR